MAENARVMETMQSEHVSSSRLYFVWTPFMMKKGTWKSPARMQLSG